MNLSGHTLSWNVGRPSRGGYVLIRYWSSGYDMADVGCDLVAAAEPSRRKVTLLSNARKQEIVTFDAIEIRLFALSTT